MIGQEEMRASASAPQSTDHTPARAWPAYDETSSGSDVAHQTRSSCGSNIYILSFVIPAATVAAIYLPEAAKAENCALATIPAVLAGTTALGLYRLCKFVKHKNK